MQGSRSRRALLTLVADLAQLGDGDVQIILQDLEPPERNRLVELLDAYRRGETVEPKAPAATAGVMLSPWLTDRLSQNDESRTTGMTLHASEALRRIAMRQGEAETHAGGHSARDARPLLARLGLRQ